MSRTYQTAMEGKGDAIVRAVSDMVEEYKSSIRSLQMKLEENETTIPSLRKKVQEYAFAISMYRYICETQTREIAEKATEIEQYQTKPLCFKCRRLFHTREELQMHLREANHYIHFG